MTMVRGSNPIWYEVDLTAHAFDDTFYMFVLDNEIPYGPLPTWLDPFGNDVWDNPIRFLANGTLPNNLYFDPDVVYRLEFRQGNTQSDPLIYLVENYVPGSSGDTPINETSFSTDNQISNPQFALVNFVTPTTTYSSISTQVLNVAPGWFLHLTGTGNVILTQVTLNSAVVNPTNASYALQIQLNGSWTNAFLSQRFTKNGVLWSNTFVSSSITALSGNARQNISAILVDSQGHTLTTVLNTTPLTEVFNEYPGIGEIGDSLNTDFPPTAYIEYQLLLPNNCDITLTSIQLISGETLVEFPYEQTTIERQIDQTYHDAFPVVPVGTVIDYYAFGTPAHYLLCNGTAISRTQYTLLFEALTNIETVTLTMGSPTITVANGALYAINTPIEGTGISGGTLISAISGNTITMSANATLGGAQQLRFFAVLNGDGSTTFNLPALSGFVIAGAFGSLFSGAGISNGIGQEAGAATHAITINEMPLHNHPGSSGSYAVGAGGGGTLPTASNISATTTNPVSVTVAQQGGGTLNVSGAPMSLIQPTALAQKMIRYE
jgi:microcystin-dependent protein